jgi:CRISPR/Cas system-associated exonuclease Cas4 (RecB family)
LVSELQQRLRSLLLSFDERRRRPNEIHVSDLTSCLRKAWFTLRFNASPEPTPAQVLGKLLHRVLRHVLSADELFKEAQFEVECSAPIEGCPGWVLRGKADVATSEAIYEFKFTKGLGFNKAHPAYFAQASAYAFMLKRAKAFLVLVDRETLGVQVLEAEPDADLWNNMLAEARILVESLGEDEIPSLNSPRLGDWECGSCPFRVICVNLKEGAPVGPSQPV